jgi:hypothetical protein
MDTSIPKIFISYSWSSADRVIELAQRLMGDGVEVILDKWELKEGQDKYKFMEISVADKSIDKVLIICDKQYAEKANSRKGGVGDETMVISPEVYAKSEETKYIPIIFERDENGKEYTPIYLKSRIYIDLSDNDEYEKNYDKLLRVLHNKPENSKPALGKMPEWLNEEKVDFSSIRNILKQIQSYDGKNPVKAEFITRKFNEEFVNALASFAPVQSADFDEKLLRQIGAVKPLRDLYLDYVEACIASGLDIAEIIGTFFECVNNKTYDTNGKNSYSESDFEFYGYIIWEAFICTTAILLHYEKYSELHKILGRTYFLKNSPLNSAVEAQSYLKFWKSFRTIEEVCKPKTDNPGLYTLSGYILIKREKKPIIHKVAIVNADLVLYQMSLALGLTFQGSTTAWLPALYYYLGDNEQSIWSKLISKSYCEKIMPLFGVTSISELKELIQQSIPNRKMRYSNDFFGYAPAILSNIQFEKIATLP